jgi:hypothetical protein
MRTYVCVYGYMYIYTYIHKAMTDANAMVGFEEVNYWICAQRNVNKFNL